LPFAFNESDEWPFEVSAALAEITLSMRQLHKQLKDIVVCLELGDKKRMRSGGGAAGAAGAQVESVDGDKIKCASRTPPAHNLCTWSS